MIQPVKYEIHITRCLENYFSHVKHFLFDSVRVTVNLIDHLIEIQIKLRFYFLLLFLPAGDDKRIYVKQEEKSS